MPAALELKNVTKRFGDKLAVDDLSLTIGEGEFVGLLGRNGAGKSTTIKMATGLLEVSSGSINVLGLDIATKSLEARRLMGVMPEDMALLELLTGPQYLRFVGRMYGLEEAVIDTRAKELFDTLDLNPGPRTLVTDYSFGMKKKLALCSALLHAPKLVFLDEPFEGIDAITNRTIKDILLSLQQKGVTLVLTSHILEVVERLCPRIAIIDEGKLKAFGTHDELGRGAGTLESLFVGLVGGEQKGSLSWL
ncbi:MAG: ABC transporter ATP-binding protein [Archangiaceae bacterium]|nr:ABC transporter ATP-binding protein [Archangiaceae bacterium]